MNEVPLFQITRGERDEWTVAVKWRSGHNEDFKDFASESLANEWVSKQAWLDESKANA
jgi:hypothetical protein